ncbi:MAG: LD-carboxypeptidase [Alphaproteobacteria bacterium]|nr:LD-carboxypeptidase [Alphaproteobacteria bacterium]
MIKIEKGSKVAVVAPSAQIGEISKISKGLKYLESIGLIPVLGKNLLCTNRYMAGSDTQRADDINSAFSDSDIKAIFCVRAAAGATRILPYIDYKLAQKNPKPVIGFCDNVALQLALNKLSGITCLNGFSLTYDFKNDTPDKAICADLEQQLAGNLPVFTSGKTLPNGLAEGQLLCANLSVLIRLAGTPYFPDLSGKILLIEDVHERLHKIDLMLQQLKQQQSFHNLKAVIFGQFTDCAGDEEDGTLFDCFKDFLQNTNIPAVIDFNFGHTPSRHVLPLGSLARLNADSSTLEILSD